MDKAALEEMTTMGKMRMTDKAKTDKLDKVAKRAIETKMATMDRMGMFLVDGMVVTGSLILVVVMDNVASPILLVVMDKINDLEVLVDNIDEVDAIDKGTSMDQVGRMYQVGSMDQLDRMH